MLHNDKDKFKQIIKYVQDKTGFSDVLIEKDYYLSLILSKVNFLSENLIFKGGTCLNKIYYSYFRLSEDLDFSMKLPSDSITRGMRSRAMKPVKAELQKYVESFGIKLDTTREPGRNENKQYVFLILYNSILEEKQGSIKFEVSLRFNPLLDINKKSVIHNFVDPFSQKSLVESGEINCLNLKEAVAEKLRAAAGREVIAPRDFYDLDFLIRNKFNIADPEVLKLFEMKTNEESKWEGLPKYRHNLGRSDKEIKGILERAESELYPVLNIKEREKFKIEAALKRINKALSKV
ncbi:MAG: hypothetical protein A2231_08055 [Candidatus Firestonebacteria bacterium RIFOXYA2_FULL_40_8]|nr:MAG: hypothetical protein A2231_08055 [Candidatus Firestonebacteria bacterium RIFOXYA2_FULL_40_8]